MTNRLRRWDGYRWVAVALGLALPVTLLVYPLFTGVWPFTANASGMANFLLLALPALPSGAVSGSRFFALYAGYAKRKAPTDQLSAKDAEQGAQAAVGPVGDWFWSGLVAAGLGSLVIAAVAALGEAHDDPFGVAFFGTLIYLPLVFTAGLAWALGAIIGSLFSLLFGSVLGILFGLAQAKHRRGMLTWLVVAAFLVFLLLYLVGEVVGQEMGAAGPLLTRVGLVGVIVLFFALVATGLPHLLHRLGHSGPANDLQANTTPDPDTQSRSSGREA